MNGKVYVTAVDLGFFACFVPGQVRMSSDELAPLSVRQEREKLARKRIREVSIL